ncbi:hypothetical protein [Paenibacillus sp. YN15]|uniref:hypothetical protein n=1 Tax=Paenibacillus sp. YN15 TaxID=1742774 RepID=UPI0015EB6678|nr:hypothetical protein [Paenibacillus sp. YN15]
MTISSTGAMSVIHPSTSKGPLHFKSLTEAELSLLLLAMDISLLPDASRYNVADKP